MVHNMRLSNLIAGYPYKATRFMIAVDQEIATEVRTFKEAFVLAFSLYFTLGINYPADIGNVMDFVQR